MVEKSDIAKEQLIIIILAGIGRVTVMKESVVFFDLFFFLYF